MTDSKERWAERIKTRLAKLVQDVITGNNEIEVLLKEMSEDDE